MSSLSRSVRLALTVSLVLSLAQLAHAEPSPLVVLVAPGQSRPDPEAVRREIARELGWVVIDAPASNARGTLSLRIEARTVSAHYAASDGRELSRSLDLPDDEAQRLQVIAWLAGNLARDEASQVAAALKPPAAPEPPAATTTPPVSDGPPKPAAETAVPAPESETRAPERPQEKEAPVAPATAPRKLEPRGSAIANLSLFHPLALYRDSQLRRVHLELGLAYSRVGELSGAGFNPGVIRVDGASRGAVFAGLWSSLRAGSEGVAASGLFSTAEGRLRGAEAAGLFVWRKGDVQGAQAAGIVVRAEDMTGAQAAGIVASARDVAGAQAAGLVSYARAVDGIQAAGLVNRARAHAGVQVSGIAGVASSISGLQVSLVNIGGDVNGV
ncbi:MAG TPA: hypothetical protein VK524_24255, partial [Polyangiaceae bacterium]|nr:hypothetical protein [Polyangiaceae bacterium]